MTHEYQTALVTGGAIRIGRALVERLLERGLSVAVHFGHSTESAEELLRASASEQTRVRLVQGDLSAGASSAERVFSAAQEALGTIDVLINNAAIFHPDSLESLSAEQFHRHMAINLEAPLFLAQAFAKALPSERRGHIINLADWRAMRPVPGHLAYTISKAGLVAATKMLAAELAPRIQVNAIAPGAILPPAGADADYEQQLVRRNPLQRVGGARAIVHAAEYLLDSDFVTGEVLMVTGGEEL